MRVDLPEPGSYLHGVVTDELAVYGYTLLELPGTWSPGTITLPGLEHDTCYRVSHLPLTVPAGQAVPLAVELTGRQLASVGIRAPQVLPERTRILVVEPI